MEEVRKTGVLTTHAACPQIMFVMTRSSWRKSIWLWNNPSKLNFRVRSLTATTAIDAPDVTERWNRMFACWWRQDQTTDSMCEGVTESDHLTWRMPPSHRRNPNTRRFGRTTHWVDLRDSSRYLHAVCSDTIRACDYYTRLKISSSHARTWVIQCIDSSWKWGCLHDHVAMAALLTCRRAKEIEIQLLSGWNCLTIRSTEHIHR